MECSGNTLISNGDATGRVPVCVIVFDLDDTLFPEADFLHSGYREIARRAASRFDISEQTACQTLFSPPEGLRPFEALSRLTGLTVNEMIEIYRTHWPDIELSEEVKKALIELRKRQDTTILILTQGRELTQTNKIRRLGLDALTDLCLIVDNPSPGADPNGTKADTFREIDRQFPGARKVAVGDNPPKDFLTPNLLGWTTIGIADTAGRNIHPVNLREFTPPEGPQIIIDSLSEIPKILS